MHKDEVAVDLSRLVDNEFTPHVDLDDVIATSVRRKRRRRAITGTALGTVGLVAGLLIATTIVGRHQQTEVGAAAKAGWTVVDTSKYGQTIVPTSGRGIAAVSASDVWTLGTRNKGDDATVALHWDGHRLSEFELPHGQYFALAAVSSNDVWAVGGNPPVAGTFPDSLIAHWDGHQWSQVPSPRMPAGAHMAGLLGVAAVSSNDVWAVGSIMTDAALVSFAVHWDGTQWRLSDVPSSAGGGIFAISARATNDVWAAAGTGVGKYWTVQKLLHWNGQTWSTVPSPWASAPNFLDAVRGIVAVGANEVWIYGDKLNEPDRALSAARWDGGQWREVPIPDAQPGSDGVQTTVDGRGGLVLGLAMRRNGGAIDHWSGGRWLAAPALDTSVSVAGLAMVPGTDTLWVLGNQRLEDGSPGPLYLAFRSLSK
ncbi:hypothetical protein F0L68_39170 [Solihabitans fulvus]|uniref:Uncharacterized protein n=1 Tax=Solihabitans fulvus TaxID=1892852 RepID=A0A5B2WJC8_9PSEU|nr:hypothetical protein [Solihabitans fulvus]KAA2250167.1 hypothetical protein F0L68_39170 [Solihabitans fulvus]